MSGMHNWAGQDSNKRGANESIAAIIGKVTLMGVNGCLPDLLSQTMSCRTNYEEKVRRNSLIT